MRWFLILSYISGYQSQDAMGNDIYLLPASDHDPESKFQKNISTNFNLYLRFQEFLPLWMASHYS